ncbi:hypothetical protein AGMMS50289_24100 [Betaproteobacteria bacterium]|nr:hypothetical protein AGMMS50289_24100 [Betaproteobacteria bacterium]
MNNRTWVRLSNVIGLVAIIALVYWVFGFIVVEAFDLRVFQKISAAIFGMSIMGILALMSGALIINIMFNLTRIAEKHNQDAVSATKSSAKRWIALAACFPLILALLFTGNYLSVQEKKAEMIANRAPRITLVFQQISSKKLPVPKFGAIILNEALFFE